MIRWIALGFAAVGWGILSFLVGLYVTFPEDAARTRLEYEFSEAAGDDYALGVEDLSLWRLSGVNLRGVDFYTLKKGRKTKDIPKPPMERTPLMHLDRLGLRVAILPTLMGKRAVAFDARVYEGAITGVYAQNDAGMDFSFHAADIDVSKIAMTGDNKLLLLGKIEGEADLSLNTEDIKASSGSIRLAFPGLGLGAGSSIAGFQLPEVMFDKSEVAFEVREGKLEVTEGTFESSVVTATLSGDISLNKKLGRSRNRLDLTFTLPEDLDQLAQISPDLKRARDTEGKYHYLISGTVLSPHARASKTGTRPASSRVDKSDLLGSGPTGLGGRSDFDPSESDEDRKAAREKRIVERRERLRKRREEREQEEDPKGGRTNDPGKGEDPGAEPPYLDEPGEDLPPGPEDMPPPPEFQPPFDDGNVPDEQQD